MNFFIIDDDEAIRSMLTQIIEDSDSGEVIGEAEDGSFLNESFNMRQVDILFIDLLMPNQDGIETIKKIKPSFNGKIIMLSQVDSKDMIAEAYRNGIEYYITKPINKYEVLSVIRKVTERIQLEKSIHDIHHTLSHVLNLDSSQSNHQPIHEQKLKTAGIFLLSELGIASEKGSKDLLNIVEYLDEFRKEHSFEEEFPPLKTIFRKVAEKKGGITYSESALTKEIQASEQRVRRAIHHSLNHLASIGLTDFSNLKFENYASKFFEFTTVSKKMDELKKGTASPTPRVNTKKFIKVFYFETKRLQREL